MDSAQFQLHAEIEERHWWFTARRKILRRLVDELLSKERGEMRNAECGVQSKGSELRDEGRGARESQKSECRMQSADTESPPHQTPNTKHQTPPLQPLATSLQPPPNAQRPTPNPQSPLIIDIGCGTGANLAGMADAYRCVGIDTSVEAIRLARRRFPQIEFIHGYAPDDLGERLPSAKLVMLNDVLEHIQDDFLLLSRVLAQMSPGAFALITVPADLSLWSQHDVSFGHYRRYDAERLKLLWRELPVRTRLVSHFNTRLYPIIKTIRGLNRWRGHSGGLAGTDFKLPPRPVNHALDAIFAGEGAVLQRALRGQRPGYSHGASLIAVLERLPGHVQARAKPAAAGLDYFNPERNLVNA